MLGKMHGSEAGLIYALLAYSVPILCEDTMAYRATVRGTDGRKTEEIRSEIKLVVYRIPDRGHKEVYVSPKFIDRITSEKFTLEKGPKYKIVACDDRSFLPASKEINSTEIPFTLKRAAPDTLSKLVGVALGESGEPLKNIALSLSWYLDGFPCPLGEPIVTREDGTFVIDPVPANQAYGLGKMDGPAVVLRPDISASGHFVELKVSKMAIEARMCPIDSKNPNEVNCYEKTHDYLPRDKDCNAACPINKPCHAQAYGKAEEAPPVLCTSNR